jgi:glycerol uptake facilitator-like aquaporin
LGISGIHYYLGYSLKSNVNCSGGHFNPAVTLGVFIAGAIQLKKALLYMLMQLIGGIMAAGIFRVSDEVFIYSRYSFSYSFSHILLHIIVVVVEQHFLLLLRILRSLVDLQLIVLNGGKVSKIIN